MSEPDQAKLTGLPRVPLATLPTPVQPLPRLSARLGIELSVKRDDLTGLAFGGNKTRKLELLLADAIAQGSDTLVTVGAVQSNHCRQTAAAAASHGLACALVLVGDRPSQLTGNLLLDELLGAELHWARGDRTEALETLVRQLEEAGAKPYRVPYGGSNHLGAAAYALAMGEFLGQSSPVDRVVLASSSGGTQAGLLLGAELFGFVGSVMGISVEPGSEELRASIRRLLDQSSASLSLEAKIDDARIQVTDRYLGGGYAVVGALERQAVRLFAETEGLLLDPVYTGRAAGGMVNMVERGEIGSGERVLFWHTGGTPALFAYPTQAG